MIQAFSCLFMVTHPQTGEQAAIHLFQIAEDESSAFELCKADLAEAEFISDTRNWIMGEHHINPMKREDLEDAAKRVLGWSAP